MTNSAQPLAKLLPLELDPFDPEAVPAWVNEQYPAYAGSSHATGPVTSVRTVQAQGRRLEIRTTYEILLDGQPVQLHLMVDSDGRLWSHVCPYETFATATELVQYILEHVPEALTGLKPNHSSHHHGHGHGGHQ